VQARLVEPLPSEHLSAAASHWEAVSGEYGASVPGPLLRKSPCEGPDLWSKTAPSAQTTHLPESDDPETGAVAQGREDGQRQQSQVSRLPLAPETAGETAATTSWRQAGPITSQGVRGTRGLTHPPRFHKPSLQRRTPRMNSPGFHVNLYQKSIECPPRRKSDTRDRTIGGFSDSRLARVERNRRCKS
jgi:hypothetical protein